MGSEQLLYRLGPERVACHVRRGRAAWVEQLALAALPFGAVPLLNALTTPYHLGVTLVQGDWAMAGFDLTCLGSGVFFAWAAWKMQRSARLQSSPDSATDHP